MTINAVRNRRNHKGLSANVAKQTIKFVTNQPITPFTPTVGLRGKPFTDSETGEKYYNYFIPATSSPLPAGLSLNARTGEITGTPTAITIIDEMNFSVDVTISVKDSLNHTAFKKSVLTIVVVDPFVVQEKTLTYDGKVNKLVIDDSIFVSVIGGRKPYVYKVTQGVLPPGVDIDQQTGKLSGTPTDVKRTFISETQVEELPVEDPIIITVTDFYETVANPTTANFNIEDVIIAVPNSNVKIKGVVPLSVEFTAFSSVTLGVQPYVYFTPAKQKTPMPLGVTLNSETGVISGTYTGVITAEDGSVTHEEYKGTLQVSVRDQNGDISSKISKIDIDAYLPLIAVANEKDDAGVDITTFNVIATKQLVHKPLKALYGEKPYIFTLWFCSYIDKQQNLSQYETAIPGVEISSADGTVTAVNGLLAGTYIIDFKVADASGTIIETAPRIMYLVDDAVIATVLTENTEYKLYVNDQTSDLNVGYTVLRAELGVPPYEFSVDPKLPDGLTFNTTATTCDIIGSPTTAGKTTCEFSVKDSTGMKAKKKHTIVFNIADHLTTSADDIEIIQVLGEKVGTVDIFSEIQGGFPPYSCTKMFGDLPTECTFTDANYSYIVPGSGEVIEVDKPKIWGNEWLPVPGGVSRGPTKVFGKLGTYISYYALSDSKGDVSPNRSRVQITVVPALDGTSNNVPKITGTANATKVNFKPITVIGGVPPYRINIARTFTDPVTHNVIAIPTLNLKTYNPDTIYGVPDQGYKGNMYFYITDKKGKSTPKFPVEFDIAPAIKAIVPMARPNIMCVQGTELYEITHTKNGSTVKEVLTELVEPLYISVSGGIKPYRFYQCDYKGVAVKPAYKLPKDFYIEAKTGVLKGHASTSVPIESSGFFCNVADKNNSMEKPIPFRILINRPLVVIPYDNINNNITFYNVDGTKSNTKLIKIVDNLLYDFKIALGKYGSGRYEYQLRIITGEADFYSNFTFNTTTGNIALIDSRSKFTVALHTKISVNVRDKFTGIVIEAANELEITVYPKLNLTLNPRCVPRLTLFRGKVITDENLAPVIITGGSGSYIVTVVAPSLPVGLQIDNMGLLSDAPEHLDVQRDYTVHVDDAIFEGVSGSMKFTMVIITPIVDIDVEGGANRTINTQMLMTASNMSLTDIIDTPMVITLNILGSISSINSLVPALTVDFGVIHPETTVLINIKAGDGIFGAGGTPGMYSTSDKKVRNGKPGGTAIKLNMGQATATIKGNGKIVGGGGGGGGAGGFDWRMMSLAKATRYITGWSYDCDLKRSKPYINISFESMVDTEHNPISNGVGKITVQRSGSGYSATVSTTISRDPSPLEKASLQKPGKPSPPVTINGASGGKGAGGPMGHLPGQQGGKSPKSGSTVNASAGVPSDAKFIKADNNKKLYIAEDSIINIPSLVLTLDYSGNMQYGNRSPANDGEGQFAGPAGEDIWSEEGKLYGCAGGGGGGYGSKGGDGGTSSPTQELKPKDIPGGFGGPGGLSIDASDCFITPIIDPSTLLYGDIKTFVDDPNNTGPQ